MKNLALATQNGSADSAGQDSGLREDSARLRKCWPGHTEQKRGLCGLGLRTPRGLREAPKVLAWPHRTEARTLWSWTPDSARTPRGSESAGLATQDGSADSARSPRGSESAGLATQDGSADSARSWTPDSPRGPESAGLATQNRSADSARSWTPDAARTPRGSESAGLATQNRSADSARSWTPDSPRGLREARDQQCGGGGGDGH